MENITLATYVRAKLGIKIADYCELEGEAYRTMAKRWNSTAGQQRIKDRVKVRYLDVTCKACVKRFDDL